MDHKGTEKIAGDDLMTSMERTTSEENERLIEGLRRDDRQSMATIYAEYASLAYGLAVRVLGKTAEAEDVVQEAFLALWRQAERLDVTRGIRSYLMTIVHNKAVDRLRQHGRRGTETDIDLELALKDPAPGPDEMTERAAEREVVRAALQDLPQEQRRAIEMTYYKGLTISEAATRLDIPVGTVKSRLRLGLAHLRRRLVVAS